VRGARIVFCGITCAAAGVRAVVLVRLLRVYALLVQDLNDRFDEAGLPSFDIARLLWLWSEHKVPTAITDVARGLGLSRSAASRLVGRAERLGLVECFRGVLDGRKASVRVTTRGRAAIHRFDAALRSSAREVGLG
jgi:DNA-binding MarR family transcriptional regulator